MTASSIHYLRRPSLLWGQEDVQHCSTSMKTGITWSLPTREIFPLPDVKVNSWLYVTDWTTWRCLLPLLQVVWTGDSGWVWDKGSWDDRGRGHSKAEQGTAIHKRLLQLRQPNFFKVCPANEKRRTPSAPSAGDSGQEAKVCAPNPPLEKPLLTPSTAEGPRGDLLLQALPKSRSGLPREAQEQMWWLSSSRAAQCRDVPCREENQGTRLARDQIVTKWPSINRVWKLEGLEAWRSEVLEQVPAEQWQQEAHVV